MSNRQSTPLTEFEAAVEAGAAPRAPEPVSIETHRQGVKSTIEAAMEIVARKQVLSLDEVRPKMAAEVRLDSSVADAGLLHDFPSEILDEVEQEFGALAIPEPGAKHFEALRASLWTRYSDAAMKVVVVVGAGAGAGASTSAANFAASLAQDQSTKVLFVDANLRRDEKQGAPTADPGTAVAVPEMLARQTLPLCPVPGRYNLFVLPRSELRAMPLSLFQSDAFDQFLDMARTRFRYVVIDAPPLQGHPECLVLARKADGVILVVESESTRKRTAAWAKQQIEAAGGKLLGVVLNKRKYYLPEWLVKFI